MESTRIEAELFDGSSAQAIPVTVHIESGQLHVTGRYRDARYPLDSLRWPERTRTGNRMFGLPDGASLHSREPDAWQRLARESGARELRVVRWQQSHWRVAVATLAFVGVCAAAWIWGMPLAARTVVTFIPHSVDVAIGEQALEQVGDELLAESRLDPARQDAVRKAWADTLAKAWPAGDAPPHTLLFRRSKVGPNAFALPGGTMVMTDELVELAGDDTDMVVGVLAHELGHVQGRHGMRQLAQSTLMATVIGLALGDVSSLAASAPVILGNLAYTRDLEREADAEAIRILRAAGIRPSVMVAFFRKIEAMGESDAGDFGLLFSTHPGSDERIARFENADNG